MTLSETAVIKVNAEHELARQMFQAIGDGFDRLERKTEQMNRKLKGIGDSIGGIVIGYFGLQQMIGGVNTVLEKHNVLLEKAAVNARRAEEATMNYALQAGNFKLTPEKFASQTGAIAVRNKMPLDVTQLAATQLLSSGFDSSAVLEGGVTDEFLQSLQAMTQTGRGNDPAMLAQAMTKWLDATGQPKNRAGVRAAGNQMFNLFGATNLQMNDMTDLAGAAEGMTFAGMSPAEILAMYTGALGTAKSPATAAEGASGIVKILTGEKNNPAYIAALKRAGLTPDDVDLHGENINDVLDRLAQGIERIPEKDRGAFLGDMFGKERQNIAAGLITRRGFVREKSAIMGGAESYANAIDYYQRTKIAAERELEAQTELSQLDEGMDQRKTDYYHNRKLQKMRDDGVPEGLVTFSDWFMSAFKYLPHENYRKLITSPDERKSFAAGWGGEVKVKLTAPSGSTKPATMQRDNLKNGPQ